MKTARMSHLLRAILGIIITAFSLAGCSNAGSPTDGSLIEPGDKVGDVEVIKGQPGSFTYPFEIQCSDMSEPNAYSCNVEVGQAVNVSTGLLDASGGGELDQIWANSNYQMFIDDRPVDVQAFGTIDYTHQSAGVIRFANVVIIASKPGEVTVRDAGVYDNGDPFTSTSRYVFTQP